MTADKPIKLYYSAGSCSTSCHIVLEESGLKYEAIEVDWDNADDVAQVNKMNPLGTLPILIAHDGRQLDQNISIQTFIADKVPERKLLPAPGTFERSEAMNWLSFVAADLHKCLGRLFALSAISTDKNVQAAIRNFDLKRAGDLLSYVDRKLNGKNYLTGDNFITADAYAFVVINWCRYLEIPLTPYKNVEAYLARIAARPAVARVLKSEGLD